MDGGCKTDLLPGYNHQVCMVEIQPDAGRYLFMATMVTAQVPGPEQPPPLQSVKIKRLLPAEITVTLVL
jgi:hypothetical protein